MKTKHTLVFIKTTNLHFLRLYCRDFCQGGSSSVVPEEDRPLQECQRAEFPHKVMFSIRSWRVKAASQFYFGNDLKELIKSPAKTAFCVEVWPAFTAWKRLNVVCEHQKCHLANVFQELWSARMKSVTSEADRTNKTSSVLKRKNGPRKTRRAFSPIFNSTTEKRPEHRSCVAKSHPIASTGTSFKAVNCY